MVSILKLTKEEENNIWYETRLRLGFTKEEIDEAKEKENSRLTQNKLPKNFYKEKEISGYIT